jgi:hypothetical protein
MDYDRDAANDRCDCPICQAERQGAVKDGLFTRDTRVKGLVVLEVDLRCFKGGTTRQLSERVARLEKILETEIAHFMRAEGLGDQ